MSASSSDKSSENQQEPASKIPAGLETLYTIEKDEVKSSLGVLILAVHWSIVRAGLRIPLTENQLSSNASNDNKKYTERLPPGWSTETPNAPTAVFVYEYVDPCKPSVKYQVKVIEIVRDITAVVTVSRIDGASAAASQSSVTAGSSQASDQVHKTAASTFELQNFIRYDPDKSLSAEAVFHRAEDLEKQIWTELMEPLGLKVIGLPPFQGPYDDKVKTETTRNQGQAEGQTIIIHHEDPLRDDRFPRGGLGPLPFGPGIPRGDPPSAGPPGGFNPMYSSHFNCFTFSNVNVFCHQISMFHIVFVVVDSDPLVLEASDDPI